MKKIFLSLLFFLFASNLFAYKTAVFWVELGRDEDEYNTLIIDDLYGPQTRVYTDGEISLYLSANGDNIGSAIGWGDSRGTALYWKEDTMYITPEDGYAIIRINFVCPKVPGDCNFATASEGTEEISSDAYTDYIMTWSGYCTNTLVLNPINTVIFKYILVRYEEIQNTNDGLDDNDPDTSGVSTIEMSPEAEYFNLQGMKVNKNNLSPGIYIVNGKKVLVR